METGGGDGEECGQQRVRGTPGFCGAGACFLCFSGVPVIIENRKVWVAFFVFLFLN